MILKKSLALFLTVEARFPVKRDLIPDGLNDTFHTLEFEQFKTLDLSLELEPMNTSINILYI